MACECVAPSWWAGPFGPRKVIGIWNWPPDMVSMLGALFTSWSKATNEKLKVMNSTIGLQANHGRADPEPGEAIFTDRSIDDALRAETIE